MSKIVIAAAGSTLAPALAVLRELGYVVSSVSDDSLLLQAENGQYRLVAEDMLQLLGLASIAAHRGPAWAPTDSEISDLIRLDSRNGA
ncbi:hypothetical protein GCM10027430_29420 [Lysobacter tyrosinilyticus]